MIMESLRDKLVTTAVIYFLFLQLAIRFGIFGPTILDLSYHLNVTQQQMSIVFSVTSAGVCFGAISSGILFKWIPKQLGLAAIVLMLGVLVTFVALIKDYFIFMIIQFIVGFTSGAAINACEAWVLEIWKESCPPYMQALQFFRGLGYILGPIIVEPFLMPEMNGLNTGTNPLLMNITTLTDSTELREETSRIYIPYMINGLMLILAAVMVFFQLFYSLWRKSSDMTTSSSTTRIVSNIEVRHSVVSIELNIDSNENEPKKVEPKLYTYSLIFLCSLFYMFFFEEVVVTYLASFATNIDLHLSKSNGAFLTSIFNLTNVIAKGVSILLALKIKHFLMLYINLIIILISLIILLIFANTSLSMLWFGVCLLGVGLSSIVASLYALMESTLTMDSMVCGILNMSGTLGSVLVPIAIANYIETFPICLIYASLACGLLCLLILIAIQLLIVCRKKTIKSNDNNPNIPNDIQNPSKPVLKI